jgi:hypothetical protein
MEPLALELDLEVPPGQVVVHLLGRAEARAVDGREGGPFLAGDPPVERDALGREVGPAVVQPRVAHEGGQLGELAHANGPVEIEEPREPRALALRSAGGRELRDLPGRLREVRRDGGGKRRHGRRQ